MPKKPSFLPQKTLKITAFLLFFNEKRSKKHIFCYQKAPKNSFLSQYRTTHGTLNLTLFSLLH